MKQTKEITNFDSNQVNPFILNLLETSFDGGVDKFQSSIDLLISFDEEATIKTTLSFLNSRNRIAKLYEMVLANDILREKMLQSSYYHKNGFDKLVLLQSGSFKIRVHNFDAGYIFKAEKNIHDHRWLFASTILKGSFEMSIYNESNSEGEKRYKNTYETSGNDSSIINHGYVYLKEREKLVFTQGQSYIMPPEELHDIKGISESGTITLMMTGSNQKSTCKLYSTSKVQKSGKNDEKVSIQRISSIINSIIKINNTYKVA